MARRGPRIAPLAGTRCPGGVTGGMCRQSEGSTIVVAVAVPASSSGASPTSSPSPAPITYPHSWTIESVDASGATWTTTVAIANVISGKTLTAYSTLYGHPCSLDPTTDAIVPFQITTTSKTSGLPASGDQELEIVNASLGVAPGRLGLPQGRAGYTVQGRSCRGRGTESRRKLVKWADMLKSRPASLNDDPWQRLIDERPGRGTQGLLRPQALGRTGVSEG